MGITANQALLELDILTQEGRIPPYEEILELINRVDIQADGQVTVLYSGTDIDGAAIEPVIDAIADGRNDIRVLNNTEAFKFLTSNEFDDFINVLKANLSSQGYTPDQIEVELYKNFLFGGTGSAWANISKRFAEATVGEVHVITPNGSPTRVFGATELPALLNNTNVTHIDGIAIDELRNIQAAYGPDNYVPLAEDIANHSFLKTSLTDLRAANLDALDNYLNLTADQYIPYIKDHDLQALSRINDRLNDLTQSRRDEIKETASENDFFDLAIVARPPQPYRPYFKTAVNTSL